MDRNAAKAEVGLMKKADSPSAYMASITKAASGFRTDGELPVALNEAHAELEQFRIALAESNTVNAKLSVAMAVKSDEVQAEALLKAGKLTVPVYNKLIALCEEKRSEQIVRLSDGDMEAAGNADADIAAIMEMLGEIPASVATDPAAMGADPAAAAVPGAGAPVVQPDPTQPAAVNPEDALDARAREIMAEKSLPYDQALLAAEAEMKAAQGGV